MLSFVGDLVVVRRENRGWVGLNTLPHFLDYAIIDMEVAIQ